jgi:hypothetical protein
MRKTRKCRKRGKTRKRVKERRKSGKKYGLTKKHGQRGGWPWDRMTYYLWDKEHDTLVNNYGNVFEDNHCRGRSKKTHPGRWKCDLTTKEMHNIENIMRALNDEQFKASVAYKGQLYKNGLKNEKSQRIKQMAKEQYDDCIESYPHKKDACIGIRKYCLEHNGEISKKQIKYELAKMDPKNGSRFYSQYNKYI